MAKSLLLIKRQKGGKMSDQMGDVIKSRKIRRGRVREHRRGEEVVVSDVMYSVQDYSWDGGLAVKGREGGGGVGMARPDRRGR
jgi:hypothetical protein